MKAIILMIPLLAVMLPLFSVMHELGEFNFQGWVEYVTVSGTTAYVTSQVNVQIMDIADPTNPHVHNVFTNTVMGVSVSGNRAYVACDYHGLQILDVTNTNATTTLGSYQSGGNASGVYVIDDLAYIIGSTAGLEIVDISNPQNPLLIGSLEITGVPFFITVEHRIAYIATTSGLQMISLNNPAQPQLIGSYQTPNAAVSVTIQNNIAYIAGYDAGMFIVDVTNPAAPSLLGIYDTPGQVYSIAIQDNIAYIADYEQGMHLVDISNPENPVLLGHYAMAGTVNSVMIKDQIAYVTNANRGLRILDVSDLQNPQLIGTSGILLGANSVDLQGNLAYVADTNVGMRIFDVSNPQNPVQLSFQYTWRPMDIAVQGSIVYLLSDGGFESGLEVYDVSDPQSPQLIETWSFTGNGQTIQVVGTTAYIADGTGGFTVLDVSDPHNLVLINQIWNLEHVMCATILDSLAYLANGQDGLYIVDVANPLELSILSITPPPNFGNNQTDESVNVVVANHTAYVANLYTGVQILDVTDPQNPLVIGSISRHPYSTIRTIYIKDDLLFLSDEEYNEISVYNIANHTQPALVKSYAWNSNTYGMWYENGMLYTGNGNNGFNILDFSDLTPVDDPLAVPSSNVTLSNYPNPFNPNTTISFDLPNTGIVALDIYNIRGQKVKTLVNEHFMEGNHTLSWNGSDDIGTAVASGIYFARISSSGKTASRKLVLVK